MEITETNLVFKTMSTRKTTNRIILHHAEALRCSAEDIHRWHLANGWSGAGYHFLVRKDGSISCVQDGEITARNKTWKKLLKLT